jgi:transposase
MGRRRPAPTLNEEQRQGLEQLHRSGHSHRERQRAHAVLLSAQGYTLDQAADVLRVDRDAVSRWLGRWERGGLDALADAPKSGRPPKVDAALETEVVAAASESPASVRRTLAKRGRLGLPATTR